MASATKPCSTPFGVDWKWTPAVFYERSILSGLSKAIASLFQGVMYYLFSPRLPDSEGVKYS